MDKFQQKELTGKFIKTIVDEEWDGFAQEQTNRIADCKFKGTGYLIGEGRRFGTKGGDDFYAEANLTHPDYERFIDIKKLKFYKRGPKDNDRLGKERKGKQIHNSPVFSYLNRIAYRINWDMAEEVLKCDFPKGFEVNVKLAGPFRSI